MNKCRRRNPQIIATNDFASCLEVGADPRVLFGDLLADFHDLVRFQQQFNLLQHPHRLTGLLRADEQFGIGGERNGKIFGAMLLPSCSWLRMTTTQKRDTRISVEKPRHCPMLQFQWSNRFCRDVCWFVKIVNVCERAGGALEPPGGVSHGIMFSPLTRLAASGNAHPDPLGQGHVRTSRFLGSDARCFVRQFDSYRGHAQNVSTSQAR